MTVDFVKGFCNYSIFGPPTIQESEQKESTEKSFFEQEKNLLKWTAINSVAHGAILLTTLQYASSLDYQSKLKKESATLFGLSFLVRQISIFRLEKLKKESEKLKNSADKDSLFAEKKISSFKDLLTTSLGDLMGWDKAQELHFLTDFCPAMSLALSFQKITTLVHEYGHYFAGRYYSNFDKDLIRVIELNESGGITKFADEFNFSLFYRFFKYCFLLGEDPFKPLLENKVAITIAGPLVENIFATSLIAAAHFQTNSYIRHFLNGSAILNILISEAYAHSAYSNVGNPSHDFAVLWEQGGIHPYASMACLVGLPVITKLGLMLRDYLKYKKAAVSITDLKEENPTNSHSTVAAVSEVSGAPENLLVPNE